MSRMSEVRAPTPPPAFVDLGPGRPGPVAASTARQLRASDHPDTACLERSQAVNAATSASRVRGAASGLTKRNRLAKPLYPAKNRIRQTSGNVPLRPKRGPREARSTPRPA